VAPGKQVVTISERGFGKRSNLDVYPLRDHRGGKGVRAMNLTEETGPIVAQLLIPEGLDLMIITDDGTIIRIPADSVRMTGRVAKGVRVMKLREGSRIVSVTATEPEEDPEEEDVLAETPDAPEAEQPDESLDMDLGGGPGSEPEPEI
ncbi:MAG: hypothetical protein K5746_06900, partial [Clostridiales bacterium]|nr:hypothetical protein [Clostridiales bacterium]